MCCAKFPPLFRRGGRGGPSRRPPSQNRRATENAAASNSKFADPAYLSSGQGQGGRARRPPSQNRRVPDTVESSAAQFATTLSPPSAPLPAAARAMRGCRLEPPDRSRRTGEMLISCRPFL